MFFEFAIEPTAISSWDRTLRLLGPFGPWHGRFLAVYPKKWRKMVVQNLQCKPVEKKKIEEYLFTINKNKLSGRRDAPFNGELPWLTNAENEHLRIPFRAIVAQGVSREHILNADDDLDENEQWAVPSGKFIPRESAEFAAAVRLLLQCSTKAIVIDPYFRADQGEKLMAVMAITAEAASCSCECEIHLSDKHYGYGQSKIEAERAVPRHLPMGTTLTIRCWKHKTQPPRIHNRYLITDIGGVQFGDSIEEGNIGDEDRISILDQNSWKTLWGQYADPATAFQEAGPPVLILGTRR